MMTRNIERRVEIAYPVLDPEARSVIEFVNLQLADNVKARRLTREGTWRSWPRADDLRIDAQELLFAKAYLQHRGVRTLRLTPPRGEGEPDA